MASYNFFSVYILEPPWRGGSNEYPQSMFRAKIRKTVIQLHIPVSKWGSKGYTFHEHVFLMQDSKLKYGIIILFRMRMSVMTKNLHLFIPNDAKSSYRSIHIDERANLDKCKSLRNVCILYSVVTANSH